MADVAWQPVWQPSLLGANDDLGFDASFAGAERRPLAHGAWIEVVPGWAKGADTLFESIRAVAPWSSHDRWMYDRTVTEPRLTTRRWSKPPDPLRAMGRALAARYEAPLRSIAANLYRDGADSVAWHGDTILREQPTAVVAILSLGAPRRFLLRPKGGGPSLRFEPGHGDLLVLGGSCQRTWEHCVPKCRHAGPRISVMFRERYID